MNTSMCHRKMFIIELMYCFVTKNINPWEWSVVFHVNSWSEKIVNIFRKLKFSLEGILILYSSLWKCFILMLCGMVAKSFPCERLNTVPDPYKDQFRGYVSCNLYSAKDGILLLFYHPTVFQSYWSWQKWSWSYYYKYLEFNSAIFQYLCWNWFN